MDNCTQMQELISRMLDEELSRDEREALRRHLEDCPDCRTMYEAFSAVSGELREDLVEPPESIRENVMSELRREQMVKRNRRSWRTALAAAAAALLVAVGLRAAILNRNADTVKLSAAALPMEANGTAVQEEAAAESEEAAEMEIALFDEAAFEAVADSEEAMPAEEYEAPMLAAPTEAASNVSASRAALGAPAAAAAAQSSSADSAIPVIDLKSMPLAALREALKGEEIRPAPDLSADAPVCMLLASDGALELYERVGELYCFSHDGAAVLHIPLTLEEIAALG